MKLSIRAFTITAAILWGAAVLLVGLANLIWPPYGQAFLELAASVYPGYEATATFNSVLIGTGYAVLDGAIGGLIFVALYNCLSSCCKPADAPQPPAAS